MSLATDHMVSIDGDRLKVRFDQFGQDSYQLFLRCKRLPESNVILHPEDLTYTIDAPARFAPMLGVELPKSQGQDLPFAPHLFEDQRIVAEQVLEAKRYAVWAGCGWGKTALALEVARHVVHRTKGRALITTLNEIVPQWISEARKFYGDTLPVLRLESRQHMRRWMEHGDDRHQIAVVNYEKWNPEGIDKQVVTEARHLALVVLDENRLKTGGGKQKWALIKSCRGIEYKLSLTATPAPNDLMEFASQASFLEKMRTEQDIIWTFFRRDEKTHRWTVKPHAREAFFEFMATWSIYIADPRRYGWRLDFPDVPEPIVEVQHVEPTPEQLDVLVRSNVDATGQMSFLPPEQGRNFILANKLSQAAKGFLYVKGSDGVKRDEPKNPKLGGHVWESVASRKPAFVADLVRREATGGAQVLVWTVYDAETAILSQAIDDLRVSHRTLTGRTKPAERLAILEDFRQGKCRVLLSRPSMLGWGMNFQFVEAMVFSGLTFSFEQFYQALRRAYRFGQQKALRVYITVVTGLEEDTLNAIDRKQGEFLRSIGRMEDSYIRARINLSQGVA